MAEKRLKKINYDVFITDICISKNVNDIYLLFDGMNDYYIFKNSKISHLHIRENPIDLAAENDHYEEKNYELYENNDNDMMSNSLKLLYGQIKSKLRLKDKKEKGMQTQRILTDLINDLGDVYIDLTDGKPSLRNERFDNISDEVIINKITDIAETQIHDKERRTDLTDVHTQFKGHKSYKDGLYIKEKKYTKSGEIINKYNFKGHILIHDFKVTFDKLGLFQPVVTLKYTNTAIHQVKTLDNKSYMEIAKTIHSEQLIDTNSQGIESILRKIFIHGINQNDNGIIKAEMDLIKDGFFYEESTGKILYNNVFDNLNSTDKDVKEAISLMNELISSRGTAIPNECTLIRFMLWSPFGFALKQMGFIDGLYSLVLWGVTDTSKSGSSINYSYLYVDDYKTTFEKANTQSAIGSRLGENTFPLILDEAKDNLSNPKDEEFNKNIVTDEIGRSVKDRTDNNAMNDFPAMRMTIRTLNPDLTENFKGEFYKRHKVLYYDQSMKIKEIDKLNFNKKYKPRNPDTPLKQLKHLGKAFADRFIPYLESQSDELYDLEALTIKILKQIENDYGISFNLNLMIKQELSNQNDDEGSIIRNGLNDLFRKRHKMEQGKTGYGKFDFIHCAKNGEISWIDYKPKKEVFAVKVSEFEREVSAIIGYHIPITETLKLLDIVDSEVIQGKFKGSKLNIVELDTWDLTYNLFGINIYSSEEWEQWENSQKSDSEKLLELEKQRDEYLQLKNKADKQIRELQKQIKIDNAKKKQREIESDKILNAKTI